MIARARRDDAGLALGRRELRDLVPGAARLERSGDLQALELEPQLDALVELDVAERFERRPDDDAFQAARGGVDRERVQDWLQGFGEGGEGAGL